MVLLIMMMSKKMTDDGNSYGDGDDYNGNNTDDDCIKENNDVVNKTQSLSDHTCQSIIKSNSFKESVRLDCSSACKL
jgi:hypothetical protein